MFRKTAAAVLWALGLFWLVSAVGCSAPAWTGTAGWYYTPIPVSPWLQDRMEDNFWKHKRYSRVPVLGPFTPGSPETSLDPPSEDEVMRALEDARPVEGGIPLIQEVQRNNVRIVADLISDHVDPPRVYPLIGPAQLHHAHYKCTVYFTEVTRVGWPLPYTTTDEDAQEVVYIDHDHFHMVGNVDPGLGSNY